ncbi:winged helix-turn-helix domain-containing protein [Aestuariivirga litoralis]|uniref:Winged helix-turn-helix domain-containing protein n=1 Tax=Aestuariivirga litoralis TaxID=2650924 RepID=A0A2W2B992_9HYPH|nr:winged helix-turn-helix domain-containing protein [Aestuariivirga litoralis]PZF76864.1 winged helix-turn-helix domain-containing protein [Aestuariivirga litoralis]
MAESLSLAQARRVALAAQGFSLPDRTRKVTWAHMAPMIRRLNLLQIDSVNVVARSHYLPLYSRLGAYAHETLDQRAFGRRNRALFECWAHEASLLPLELHPLMRWRMARARAGDGTYKSMDQFGREERAYLAQVLDFVTRNGPTVASEVPGGGKAEGGWWGWSRGKLALETLFDQGLVTTATRDGFERLYDIPERVIPSDVLARPTPPEPEAIRQLLDLSARALGVATEIDLRDYFRLPIPETKTAIAELVEDGVLLPVKVEGWKPQGFLHREARFPRKAGGTALLSPFDPVVWERSRAERLFEFHYRIEIYTPAKKRQFGYYVLPFLHRERIAGRVCLKADRQAGVLRANASHHEGHADPGETAEALAGELRLMAGWLGLQEVAAGPSGNLARALKGALRAGTGAA